MNLRAIKSNEITIIKLIFMSTSLTFSCIFRSSFDFDQLFTEHNEHIGQGRRRKCWVEWNAMCVLNFSEIVIVAFCSVCSNTRTKRKRDKKERTKWEKGDGERWVYCTNGIVWWTNASAINALCKWRCNNCNGKKEDNAQTINKHA